MALPNFHVARLCSEGVLSHPRFCVKQGGGNVDASFISDAAGQRICTAIPARAFQLFALSLDAGPNFDIDETIQTWMSEDRTAIGMTFRRDNTFGHLVMRRREDRRWVLKVEAQGFASPEIATDQMVEAMRIGEPPDPVPSGSRRRPPLYEGTGAGTYAVLTDGMAHYPAMFVMGEIYLALPNPDRNFATDMRTANFDSRMWELYLFACFREQGLKVSQAYPSPDFFIERNGATAFVEAVTAHSSEGPIPMPASPTFAPEDRSERIAGEAAARFAKTIRSKLQKNYDACDHVQGKPFAIAIADFHQSASMVWSREALPTYLYGVIAEVIETPDGPIASGRPISHLLDKEQLPAGLFRDPQNAHLSAVVFSNAGTMAKFNRMGFIAGIQPLGLRMERAGLIFDRRPGTLEPIEFRADILTMEYEALWPGGECWCQELEVYHNPLATHPMDHDLLPGATHWFERDRELICKAFWENTFLSSVTTLTWDNEEIRNAMEREKAR